MRMMNERKRQGKREERIERVERTSGAFCGVARGKERRVARTGALGNEHEHESNVANATASDGGVYVAVVKVRGVGVGVCVRRTATCIVELWRSNSSPASHIQSTNTRRYCDTRGRREGREGRGGGAQEKSRG